ncbi:MAG: hypothetical protein KBD55_01210 [Candidatus Pacebacteria bacterium]|nr:hypothetical protein [Candidatus Paceibacterota bacterium]
MSKDMLGPLTRALVGVPAKMLGLVLDITNRLGSADSDTFYSDLAKFVREWKKAVAVIPSLLEFVRTTTAPDTSEPFIANAKFKLKKDGGICSYLGDNFNAWFLAGTGNIDAPGGETTLTISRLTKASVDQPILDELGDKTDVALVDMFAKMEAQSKGQPGELLVDGRVNIFYVRDQDGVLRPVYVHWLGDGWCVNACSTDCTAHWYAAYQVFSRNSALTYSAP